MIIAALAMASITVTAQTNVKKTINKADMDLTAKPERTSMSMLPAVG